jgi:hypothetical protein
MTSAGPRVQKVNVDGYLQRNLISLSAREGNIVIIIIACGVSFFFYSGWMEVIITMMNYNVFIPSKLHGAHTSLM